jgi:hypothetical protein|tara:strand:+ start:444 stop:701 length:258 start_codon:yes stop_codon:yes gene_type:complete
MKVSLDDPIEEQVPEYTAQFCSECEKWIYVADGPFAENDRTKPMMGDLHYQTFHPDADQFKYMFWNEKPVAATVYLQPMDDIDAS